MATLVFTAVGTAFGGPVGGAIGSLLGQSLDQQIFGSAGRGPRLGDLSVQTSTYGTQIPRIYGTMRVAGSIIWATDLQESTTQTGAKGQPDTTVYSYSVSFAVALSSRPIRSIKRIWADGKPLRGAGSDFKVNTQFRFYDGSEGQIIDPLIGALEGIAQTPAYRGLALAVFEDLELAEYGNRIPFLTFEVEADAVSPTIGQILSDASKALIQCNSALLVDGYAAHGMSMRSALEPLIEQFAVDLFDDGTVLRSASAEPPLRVPDCNFGNSGGVEQVPRVERTQIAAHSLPATITLSYYDLSRDYQTSQMRGSIGEADGRQENIELPVVLDAGRAKALVQSHLARHWAQRDQMTLRLPPHYMSLEPGSTIELSATPSLWTVEECITEEMVVVVHLRTTWQPIDESVGDSGRSLPSSDRQVSETKLALFDLPDLEGNQTAILTLHVAGTSSSDGWRSVPIEVKEGGSISAGQTATRKSILGTALAILPAAQPYLLDSINNLEVELVDQDQWLESCNNQGLVQGFNLAALGSELIQFGTAEPVGPGRFRLSKLLRGRRGTEWAMDTHMMGEAFALLQPGTLRPLSFPLSMQGAVIEARPLGLADAAMVGVSKRVGGEALRPPSPVHITIERMSEGTLHISWIRRSRHGWAWLDEIDVPLGEARELYRVILESSTARIESETASQSIIFAEIDLASLGAGDAILSVQQIGDRAASRAASSIITL